MKGYKIFNPDFTCRGFQFKENTIFETKGPVSICNSGFHFCTKASHCFSYYSFNPKNIVCEVEALGEVKTHGGDSKALGEVKTHGGDSKACTNKLQIGRRLTWQEVLIVANEGANNTGHSNSGNRNSGNSNSGDRNSGNRNSGDSNSGYSNSGNWNSGDSNSGDSNSGNWNSGNRNSGDSNSGYRNSGAFCLDDNPVLYLFDKATNILVKDWEQSEAVQIMSALLENTIFIYSENMTDDQKKENPTHETTGGFLKVKTMQETWIDMWCNLSEKKRSVFTSLPNFDAEKFFKITGVKI